MSPYMYITLFNFKRGFDGSENIADGILGQFPYAPMHSRFQAK